MMRYSALALLRGALSGHRNWPPAWRSPEPKPQYDVVIVGGGGHGLASAYYLAKNHGITNVAVLERGWLGGGNTGRNTTVVRSNYLYPESARLYELLVAPLRGPGARAELQRHAEPARPPDAGAQPPRPRVHVALGQYHGHARHRCASF